MGLMRVRLCPHTFISGFHHIISRMYLVVLVVVLSSTTLSDSPPDHGYGASTQNDVTALMTIYPGFWTDVDRKFSQNTQKSKAELTGESLTSSPSEYSKMKTLINPSTSVKISTKNSGSQEYSGAKVTTDVDDRTTISQPKPTMSGSNYDFHSLTTSSSIPETVANVCDTDQLEVTTNPVYINASTYETYCSLLVNAPNGTVISVSVLDSGINNAFTYFYLELSENPILDSSKRISLLSLDNTPCVTIIQGNQFRFHFQNTETKVRICNKKVQTSVCYGTVHPNIEATKCRITQYESQIPTSQSRQTFKYGSIRWYQISVDVTQFETKCTCDCPDTCICTLGYRQWLSACTNANQDNNTTTAALIVYKPTMKGLSFDNTGLHAIQHDAFLGLEGVVVLILSNNKLSMLQPTVCQNLPQLEVLKLDNNKLVNLTSDLFTGPCSQKLLMLNLQSNKLTYISHDVFNSTSKLKYLNLRQNRLVQLPIDLFSSLEVLQILRLDDNAISTLPAGVFDPLVDLQTLDLSDNSISTLPAGVFDSLGGLHTLDQSGNSTSTLPASVFDSLGDLWTLDLSGNSISTLPVGVFDSLGDLWTLDLSGNSISTLPVGVFDSLGDLWTLDLSGNSITILPDVVFASLGRLSTLDLSGNNISTLPVGVFDSQGDLITLDLSGNSISILPVGVFDSLGVLQTLDLSGNSITILPDGVFASLGRLSTLDLSGNNISTLTVGVFDSQRDLITLDLSGNSIFILPVGVFDSLGDLSTLDLCGNSISILPVGVFASQGRLYFLDLSDNTIFTLSMGVFDALDRLYTLDLSDNTIFTLPVGVFDSLVELITLDLSGNIISTLHAHVFDHLNKLLTLDLSNNELLSLPGKLFLMLRKLISLNLCCNNLTINASQTFESLIQLKILDMSKNGIEQFPSNLFVCTGNLLSLQISENNLRTIPVTLFRNMSRLVYLNMSKNSLSRLPSFNAQGQLQVLDVSENQLTTLKQVTFENLENLILLSISKNSITILHGHVFFHLDNIKFINASYNAIQKIGSKVVNNETKLNIFDLRGNEMYKVTSHSFTSLTNSTIIVDKYPTCCFMNEQRCISLTPRTEYLTCNRMLRDVVLRISVWVLGLSAFICNVLAYCLRSRKQQAKIKVQTLLISHLALSDLLMGVNMLILAIADVYYGQYFPSYAHTWRQSFACKLAGFLSIFSSEGSVFFITLISIDRMLRIKYPFGGRRLEIKSARICVALAWLMALLISVIPISLTSDEGNFYSISEVCIGIPIVRRHLTTFMNKSAEINTTSISSSVVFGTHYNLWLGEYNSFVRDYSISLQKTAQNITYTIAENAGSQVGSIYSIVVFISVNLFCFVIVACCYLYIFLKAKQTTERASGSQSRNDEIRMAKKMFAIVFTDFCCWVPLSFLCILTQSGVIEVSPEMYAWTVGFILPINSSINPFLYVLYDTISDYLKNKQEKRKEREEIEMQVRWKPLKKFGLRFDENK